MAKHSATFIDSLGGTSAVSKLTDAPTSTVHSWRTIGIPASRLSHLRMIAQAEGKPAPDEAAINAEREQIAAERRAAQADAA